MADHVGRPARSAALSAAGTGPLRPIERLVLDTNVALDLFVFDDPALRPLRAALAAGLAVALTDRDCRDEWLRVLDYPQLRLAPPARAAAIAAFDAQVQALPAAAATDILLPRCRDADDQKFLVAATAAGAHVLLSRDDALLRLGPRLRRAGLFEVLHPRAWVALHALRQPGP